MNEKGLHIIANFFGCKNSELLVSKSQLSGILRRIVTDNELIILKEDFHKFWEEGGITGYILLSKSHISVHTWPERDNYITLDIFVCNYNKNNRINAKNISEELKKVFQPEKIEEHFIDRD